MGGYDDENDSWDGDDEAEFDGEEESIVPCPYCKAEILEDSPRCPVCERYISEEDLTGPRRPLWVVFTALVCLAIAVWWAFSGH